jgi:hypothetical protein
MNDRNLVRRRVVLDRHAHGRARGLLARLPGGAAVEAEALLSRVAAEMGADPFDPAVREGVDDARAGRAPQW